MGRVSGARNRDHAATKAALAERLAHQLLVAGGTQPSLRTLATGAGVDPGTLRHYFGDRRGVVQAAFDALLAFAPQRLAQARALGEKPAREALKELLTTLATAWPGFLGAMHAAGFVEGMADADLGQTYVSAILEPTLNVVEELLTTFRARGEVSVSEPRIGALALLSPLLIALFHQHQLSGRRCRPLDMSTFVEAHLDGFLRGYGPRTTPQSS